MRNFFFFFFAFFEFHSLVKHCASTRGPSVQFESAQQESFIYFNTNKKYNFLHTNVPIYTVEHIGIIHSQIQRQGVEYTNPTQQKTTYIGNAYKLDYKQPISIIEPSKGL